MKKSVEQQLIEKCKKLDIALDIQEDRIYVDVESPRVFGTQGNHWEHCVIPTENEWEYSAVRGEKYNYTKERNASIRVILEAIDSLSQMDEGEKCADEDCEECNPE